MKRIGFRTEFLRRITLFDLKLIPPRQLKRVFVLLIIKTNFTSILKLNLFDLWEDVSLIKHLKMEWNRSCTLLYKFHFTLIE